MKKIILSILIVLLFFTMGVSIAQEKELAEKAKLKRMGKELELIMKQEENHKKLLYLYEEIKKIKKEIEDIDRQLEENYVDDEFEKEQAEINKRYESKTEFERSQTALEEWLREPSPYSARENEFDENYLKKLEEENDRLEDLLWDLKRISGNIDVARWQLELAKPDPLDFMKAYEMFKPYMEDDLWFYWWLIKK